VYSRSEQSAVAAAQETGVSPDVYFGSVGEDGPKGLNALFKREDIHAVAVALPIALQPHVVVLALEAGLHVISEKPISPDVPTGKRLINDFDTKYKPLGLVWSVAENYRYESCFDRARTECQRLGQLYTCELRVHNPMPAENQFARTAWRREPEYIGGFLLDGGCHFIAAIRKVVGQACRVVQGQAATLSKHLPAPDTVIGNLRFEGGALARCHPPSLCYDTPSIPAALSMT